MSFVELRDIVKVYPDGVVALRGVSMEISEGEIHGLLGENGAGKTTLMRILYGEIRPTRGEVFISGRKVSFRGPWDAIKNGISMVYQKFTLVPTFTVLENLYLPLALMEKGISIDDVRKRAERLLDELNLRVPVDSFVEELPVGVQQRVEILRALLLKSKILILDEPTSVLTPIETKELFRMLKELKKAGITVIFITHKLKEVRELADRITVLRKGMKVGTVNAAEVTESDLARMMVGHEIAVVQRPSPSIGEKILEIRDLWVKDDRGIDAVKGVSLELYEGEILGIAGVQGNGQLELAEAIAGMRRIERGAIFLNGREITNLPARLRYRYGLAYIPDSRSVGLVAEMNLTENSVLTSLSEFIRKGRIKWSNAVRRTSEIVDRFNVVTPSLRVAVRYLSGGNQQRLLVGREITKEPRVLIIAEPTHGLDVAATDFIRKILLDFRDKGKAILLISTDLDEIFQLSDRIAVMYEGRIVGIGRNEEFSPEKIGLLMGGVHAQDISS
jgi:ABC-type uncharacterized transport system ATPase subunit